MMGDQKSFLSNYLKRDRHLHRCTQRGMRWGEGGITQDSPRRIFKKLFNKNAMKLKIGIPHAIFKNLLKKCKKLVIGDPPPPPQQFCLKSLDPPVKNLSLLLPWIFSPFASMYIYIFYSQTTGQTLSPTWRPSGPRRSPTFAEEFQSFWLETSQTSEGNSNLQPSKELSSR